VTQPPNQPPVGSEEPLQPEHSLPSYNEPTPETHRKISREDEAELALTRTTFTPGTQTLLIALFLLTIVAVPAIQLASELRAQRPGALPMFDVFKTLPSWTQVRTAHGPADLWHLLPRPDAIKAAEKALENESVISQSLRPHVQATLTGSLRAGSEQAYPGRDGWLFYRPDVDYITGPPFLDPTRLKHRAHAADVQPDPVKAIVAFRDQLAARGIELIVMPVPVKPGMDGEMLSAGARNLGMLQNSSFAEFKSRLEKGGVRVFDPAPLLRARKAAGGGAPLYLETDTHWRPETMEFVAQELAAFLHAPAPSTYQIVETEIATLGDIATMLKLPAGQRIYRPQKVTIQQVTDGNTWWHPRQEAGMLLLGDSFSNIFSLEPMGWGEAAGFAEHLSHELGQPLDCILRNSDGAFATREILSRELARGRDRLAGKTQVVWEFAARELAFGNWKLLEMKLGSHPVTRFFSPKPGEEVMVSGTVVSVSPVPRPGTVPYKDHIATIHLADLQGLAQAEAESVQALAYLWSMRDNVWTRAARLHPGDRVTLRLRAWSDVSASYDKINRSETEDTALQLEEPVWAEPID
jgi:alginate O-acetyltransferase complex protein AlgJ